MKQVIAVAIFAITTIAHASTSDSYPVKPIRMLLPYGAGGGGDVVGRLLADRMALQLKQPIVVENKPGAAGTIGTRAVAVSPPDGYTIMIGGMSSHTLAPATYTKLPYDPIRDFASLGQIGTSALVVVAANSFPAGNLAELRMVARHSPVQYASWGQGSGGHFCGEILRQKGGIPLQHIPYKGTSQIITDILGGHISLGVVDMVTATPFVKEGKIKALAVCTQRSPSMPQVASYREQGIDFDRVQNWVMYAPAGTPRPIVEKLSNALKVVLKEKPVIDKLLSLGVTVDYVPGEQQQATNANDIPIWKAIATESNIHLD
ncbi:Bug family tripartite tricarboxylate transporter substrate binding protein [Cupriavidus sp. BIC8F]|uniref:Bug family tripartite tricarboxylate transporter substrate binding protein n=1 Tax=Cupriavidus sp. BIC8F TaxID=3079014 RepID=UPI002916F79F|nr:tripartite tricarboxylate transporter substrate-binding protein [Cupriavidus sp. BIC8F]